MKRFVGLLTALMFIFLNVYPCMAQGIDDLFPSEYLPMFFEEEHSYDTNIIDGGVYCLRNVYDGTYLDVDNSLTADGTGICTYFYHGEPNQCFTFHYLGQGIYEIKPIYVDRLVTADSDNGLTIRSKTRTDSQNFRVHMVSNNTGVIMSKSSGYTKALTFDVQAPRDVKMMTYSTLTNPTQAQWVFERVDASSDTYGMYYLCHAETGLYVDVIEAGISAGTLVHARSFLGNFNQEWKIKYKVEGYYVFEAGHRRDMVLCPSGTYMGIQNEENNILQGFQLIPIEIDDCNNVCYQIKIIGSVENNTYLKLGNELSANSNLYYIDSSETPEDLWILKKVKVDAKNATLLTLNHWENGEIYSAYQETKVFTYIPTTTSRYKIELPLNNVDVCNVNSQMGGSAHLIDVYTYRGMRIADVFLQAGVIYYIPIEFDGTVSNSSNAFSIRVRQLTAVGHGAPRDGATNFHECIEDMRSLCTAMGMSFKDYPNASASQALQETHSLTQYSDFNSEIFCYSGHGDKGYAVYSGAKKSEYLAAEDLPDMSNCELVIWNCCFSASEGGWFLNPKPSLVDQSIQNGAAVAIGWSDEIDNTASEYYQQYFFGGLLAGMSVSNASAAAVSSKNIDQACTVVTTISIQGDIDRIIFPVSTAIYSAKTTNVQVESIVDRSAYTFFAENDSLRTKLYVRMINGVPTDDYFLEFYDSDGKLISIKKSAYTLTDEEVALLTMQVAGVFNNTDIVAKNSTESEIEYQIRYIDDEFRLVEKRTSVNDDCSACKQIVFYDAITGEAVLK